MSQAKAIILTGLVSVIGTILAAWFLMAQTSLLDTKKKADEAVTQTQYEALDARVDALEVYRRDFERFRENIQSFRHDVNELNNTIGEVRYSLRSTNQTMDQMASDISYLKNRQEPLWDSMTILCSREGITCPMRNALWSPGSPFPQPEQFELRYAYHKAPAQTVGLVDDAGEGA